MRKFDLLPLVCGLALLAGGAHAQTKEDITFKGSAHPCTFQADDRGLNCYGNPAATQTYREAYTPGDRQDEAAQASPEPEAESEGESETN